MRPYPSGTVTFLFTDVEGSTRLAQEHPREMPALMGRHNEILRRAVEAHEGYVFQTVGDSFAVAFHNAGDALNAAAEAQRCLQQEPWAPAPVRVRMGIHTGAARPDLDSKERPYSGYATLALTQRIMSAGHGGQILISQAARDLVKDVLPERAELRDLGEHRLKDVLQPEHLYQLALPGLPLDFGALNTLDTSNHNLPAQLTSFIGRAAEIRAVEKLIHEHDMVTLTGSGGCGKTRLALQAAGEMQPEFTDGAWLVELARLADPALIAQAVANVFNLRVDGPRTHLQALTDYLHTKHMLLILDNCEHVIGACAQLSESLLQACRKLKILATSREPLGIAGEVPYRVPSLKTPDLNRLPSAAGAPVAETALAELRDMEAVQLFLARVAVVKPDFALTRENAGAVAQICARLDGIPLAIELAAARMKVLPAEQIAKRLDDRFRLLTGGARTALPRQQTLRALIDWSYGLLSEPEKTLFRRLAVFAGGWMLEAAEAICGEEGGEFDVLDLLAQLVDKSLVNAEEAAGDVRYTQLETIRQYAREKLFESDEVARMRDRHLAFYVRFAEATEREMQGPGHKMWARRSRAEQDNLRAAVEWGLSGDPESALQIAASLVLAITSGGFSAEGFRWLGDGLKALESTSARLGPALKAKALSGLSFVYLSLGNNLSAKHYAEESVGIYREIGDRSGLAMALLVASQPIEFLGELGQAEAMLQEAIALARAEESTFIRTWALNNLARVTIALHGDAEAALRYTEEAVRSSRQAGIAWTAAESYQMQALIAGRNNQFDRARGLYEEALRAFEDLGASFNANLVKSDLAHLERQVGHYEDALNLYRETIAAFRDMGQTGAVAHQLECFGFIALARDETGCRETGAGVRACARSVELFAAADSLRERAATPMRPEEQVYFDEQVRTLRAEMDAAAFDAAWGRGSALSIDEAIALAVTPGLRG